DEEDKIGIHSSSGAELAFGLDSTEYNSGWVMHRDGYAGYLDRLGREVLPLQYKSIKIENGKPRPVRFPRWDIYAGNELLYSQECDSLRRADENFLLGYLNGVGHLIRDDEGSSILHDIKVIQITDGQLIVQNESTKKWSVLSSEGKSVISGYDSIFTVQEGVYVPRNDGKHYLYNKGGELLERKAFEKVSIGLKDQLIVKRNGYWGLVEINGNGITASKFDRIQIGADNYFISYLNRWGIMDRKGEWILRPEFAEVFSFEDFIVGRRGQGYSIFQGSNLVTKTTDRPVGKLGSSILFEDEHSRFRLYGPITPQSGEYFDKIQSTEGHYMLYNEGRVSITDFEGEVIVPSAFAIEEVGGFSEDRFLIKKEGRWGFVDDEGRLVISNRYDSARVFEENRAAILLRNKWGFIDSHENLKVQPYYDEVSNFSGAIATAKRDGSFGLINKNGKEVIGFGWHLIRRLASGNYLVRNGNDAFGLVDDSGTFILRPAYDTLEDTGNEVLVSKNGKWSILEYTGQPRFETSFEKIISLDNLLLIKNWN
ncbi:MAG: WG repeat-containing protein, partial [Ekhidna sp.]|nr:WG repeat-containing protein [Ekhidna sp.]